MGDDEARDRWVQRAFGSFLNRVRDKAGPVHAAALLLHWDEDTTVTSAVGDGGADNVELLLDLGVELMDMLLSATPKAERAELVESLAKHWLELPEPGDGEPAAK
jgi:hypothetical protein